MPHQDAPNLFRLLLRDQSIDSSDLVATSDGFYMVHKSIADILASKDVFDFLDSSGERLTCDKFFDDWFLYAVPDQENYTYGLLKLREQEHDTAVGTLADGDTPGVTISFISFGTEILRNCLNDPTEENRKKLNLEINRVVANRGQRHNEAIKKYFKNPESQGAYLVADMYIRHIASFAENKCLSVPEHYKKLAKQSALHKKADKSARLPRFIESLNASAGRIICDNENIYIENRENPTEYEALAILATHTGNTSLYSFAAEVEYHARFLTPLARIKLPFGKSVYDSAIRADMTVDDTEFQGPAPFYKENSKIVKRQYGLHRQSINTVCRMEKQ